MRIGRNMKNILDFVTKYDGWFTFNARCKATCKAVQSLKNLKLIETNCYNQMRLFKPDRPLTLLNSPFSQIGYVSATKCGLHDV